jgi:hypothetical protein
MPPSNATLATLIAEAVCAESTAAKELEKWLALAYAWGKQDGRMELTKEILEDFRRGE